MRSSSRSKADVTDPGAQRPGPVLYSYWGRRGPIADWCDALAGRSLGQPETRRDILSLSTSGEASRSVTGSGVRLVPVATFDRGWEPLVRWDRFAAARRMLVDTAVRDRVAAVVTLMPHVWSPLVTPALRRAGVRTVTVVHDGAPHPGDPTARLTRWLLRDARLADAVVTLSGHVTDQLVGGGVPGTKITTLFLPALGVSQPSSRPVHDGPPRLLFLGRILPYKGLPLAVETLERLAAEGLRLPLTVAGEGDVAALRPRLEALGATLVDHWLSQEEIDRLCATHDAMLLSHVSASQSGVAALALAAGLPMVATPVGGLRGQVEDGVTGLVAAAAQPDALAATLRRLVTERGLLDRLRAGMAAQREATSFATFADRLEAVARGG